MLLNLCPCSMHVSVCASANSTCPLTLVLETGSLSRAGREGYVVAQILFQSIHRQLCERKEIWSYVSIYYWELITDKACHSSGETLKVLLFLCVFCISFSVCCFYSLHKLFLEYVILWGVQCYKTLVLCFKELPLIDSMTCK